MANLKRVKVWFLLICLILSAIPCWGVSAIESYSGYSADNKDESLPVEDVSVAGNVDAVYRAGETASFDVDITKGGLYELELSYISGNTQDVSAEFRIDGQVPFEEALNLTFPAYWQDGDTFVDDSGNSYAPEQILYDGVVSAKARDYAGWNEDAYRFSVEEGTHTLELVITQGEFTLKGVKLCAVEQPLSYQAWYDSQSNVAKTDKLITIEGESAAVKNNRSLISLSDSSSPMVNPSDAITSKLNYIGGTNWQRPGLALTWNFNVEETGYYSLGFMYRQNGDIGSVSYRDLKIDGKTPFAEAKRIKFSYTSDWKYTEFGGDEPYLLYLEAGPHTMTLTVSPGDIADIYTALRDLTALMGDFYIDMTMVIGEVVDPYRSYELFNMIPDYNERLDQIINGMQSLIDNLSALQDGNTGSNISNLQNALRTVQTMRDNPYSAHQYKSSFYSSYTNISAMMGDIVNMPLDIDRIFLVGNDTQNPSVKVSAFNKLLFSLRRFFHSFVADYSTGSSENSQQEELVIWANWGRDQVQVLNSMIQSDFVVKEGIPVRVEMVNATLVNGILSGKGPDLMLQMGITDPVNYAMRGALVELSQFEDFSEVCKRFTADATVPFRYNGKAYALPDTMSYNVMFVRTDIMEELGLDIPQTWDEFIYASTILQRNNLRSTMGTVAQGSTQLQTQFVQNGLSLYNEDLTATTLTEPAQIQVFSKWTDWYTKYGIPAVLDFYNYFRLGSAPLGIAPYTLITQLETTAPEIEGRWTIAPIPGTMQADGSVDHTVIGGVTGCAITKLSQNPENAWKFLKWWTDANTQLKYSNGLESVLGELGRVAVANSDAFAQQHWDADLIGILKSVREDVTCLPELPGGYYIPRGIYQAFWSVNEQGDSPEDSLLKWGTIVDKEIARKIEEYSN